MSKENKAEQITVYTIHLVCQPNYNEQKNSRKKQKQKKTKDATVRYTTPPLEIIIGFFHFTRKTKTTTRTRTQTQTRTRLLAAQLFYWIFEQKKKQNRKRVGK